MMESFGIDFNNVEYKPLLNLEGLSGTYEVIPNPLPWNATLLLVRIPGAYAVMQRGEDPIAVYGKMLWTLFGSVAALELNDNSRKCQQMSLPVLGGGRNYDPSRLMTTLLHHSIQWLKTSRYMHTINFYVYEEKHLNQWVSAMNNALGRTAVSMIQDKAAMGLRGELLSYLRNMKSNQTGTIGQALMQIEKELSTPGSVLLANLAIPARTLMESILIRLCESRNIPFRPMDNEKNIINLNGHVAPWILSHFHSLRIFGNATIHDKSQVKYIPPSLVPEDLVAILSSLQRILLFWDECKENI